MHNASEFGENQCVRKDSCIDVSYNVDRKFTSYRLHENPGAKTITIKAKRLIAKANQTTGNRWQPETYLEKILLVRMMSEVCLGHGEHKSDDPCLKHGQEISAYAAQVRPGAVAFIGPGSESTWQYDTKPKEKKSDGRCDNVGTYFVWEFKEVGSLHPPGTHNTVERIIEAQEQWGYVALFSGS